MPSINEYFRPQQRPAFFWCYYFPMLDTAVFHFFNAGAGQSAFFDTGIIFLTSYLPYLLVAAFMVWLTLAAYARREKMEIIAVTLLSVFFARGIIVESVRYFYHRERPFTALDLTPLFNDAHWSFPSGHAAFFFALATAVYLYDKRWGACFLLGALFIGLGRVAAGVHWPTDIIAGAGVGIGSAFLVFWAIRRYTKYGLP